MKQKTDRRPAVKLVRGPLVVLPPHPQHARDEDEFVALCRDLRLADPNLLLGADLFSGAGGLSLGLEQAGVQVVLGADHSTAANETHAHHFGGLTVDWDLADTAVVERIARLMRSAHIDVLAGGPPCQPFSKAGRSKIRHRVRAGLRDPLDSRRDLWRSFLEVAELSRPKAVIMENVPDMALDREMFILRSMVLALERMGYSVETRIVQTSDYGVPQYRRRLILVALRDGLRFTWPAATTRPVTLRQAIGDLPPVKGGWRPADGSKGPLQYPGPVSTFQREMRRGEDGPLKNRIFDHITRPVRDDDLEAFELMDSETRYSDLPESLRRYRADIFDDKYKRLEFDRVCRTITAHIAKDGYWYIHPEQNRTLTIREAARIQTFPDNFRFAGTPTAAFRQIGNAVPPRLGFAIGAAVRAALSRPSQALPSREASSIALASWWRAQTRVGSPWLHGASRWQIVMAEHLLDRRSNLVVESIWPLLARWPQPKQALANRAVLIMIGRWLGRENHIQDLLILASLLEARSLEKLTTSNLEDLVKEQQVNPGLADIAALAGNAQERSEDEEPVILTQAVVRVASRVLGEISDKKNLRTDGRLAIARMIGFGDASREAHLALLEIGRSICRPTVPSCDECPLLPRCNFARLNHDKANSNG
jgi:DNA (cytosine-5)-methyltransferase 1